MKQLLMIAVACWSGLLATAQDTNWAQQARAAYDAGDYGSAAAMYDSAMASGSVSAALHYNLGNCHYRLGQTGAGILQYEKALRLDPDNADILFNLRLANLRITDRVAAPQPTVIGAGWQRLLLWLSLRGWSLSAIILLAISALLLGWFVYRWKRQPMPAIFVGAMATLFIGLLLVVMAWQRYLITHPVHDEAIVLLPNVYVKASPDDTSTDLFILHEGIKVTVEQEEEGWVRIAVEGDKVGWVQAQAVGII